MMKMNLTNDQAALEYALYMIVGSYFPKTIREKSKFQEQKLFLYYQEQKRENQYFLEEQCIRYAEHTLLPMIPEKIWEQKVEVHFRRVKGAKRCICFKGKDFVLAVSAEYKGRRKADFASCFKIAADREPTCFEEM